MQNEIPLSRREFIQTLTMAAASTVLTLLPGEAQPSSLVVAGNSSEFNHGKFKKILVPDGSAVYVTRTPGKVHAFMALSGKCTHKGCGVLWMPDRNIFRCPCHSGIYNALGKNIDGPPPSPLKSLSTHVKNGVVFVQV